MLATGVLIGATGASAVEALTASSLDTGVFSVRSGEEGRFFVALHGQAGTAPATVALQILNERGGVVVQKSISLAAGRSTSVAVDVPGRYRGHASITGGPVFGSESRVVGSAEVGNDLTLVTRPVCPIPAIDESHNSTRP
jgi:hypothetical protein